MKNWKCAGYDLRVVPLRRNYVRIGEQFVRNICPYELKKIKSVRKTERFCLQQNRDVRTSELFSEKLKMK